MAKFTAYLYVGPYGQQEKHDADLDSWEQVKAFVDDRRKDEPWMMILKGGPIVHTIFDGKVIHNRLTPRDGDED